MEQFKRFNSKDIIAQAKPGQKILFANVPADGHFNPLTGLAVHLKHIGCDVRWYGGKQYADKVRSLDIPYYNFVKGVEINPETFEQDFPGRDKIKSVIGKLNFDIINVFILRGPEYLEDIKEIHKSFPFDVMIADSLFSAIPLVKKELDVPVISVGVVPLPEVSKDLAPYGLALTPAASFFGRRKQDFLRFMADKVLFRKANKVMRQVLSRYGIAANDNVFSLLIKQSTLVLQIGSPGFEYKRSDLGSNIRFVGPLLPYSKPKQQAPWFDKRLEQYKKVLLVTQGTVEKDVNKLLAPTLEAFKDSNYLVIATTGGSGTAELRERFPHQNLIIEDFIPFNDVMPYCSLYITNGGYGGVMLGISHGLPMVVAGVHEGKNEINARIGYFKLGANLKTELPTAAQIKAGVETVLADKEYKKSVMRLKQELSLYNPLQLSERYILEVIASASTGKASNSFKAEVLN
ncbi:MAG TPA: glycosyltransferase [Chitinophagaceae bacterium]|nr:glycosyltransferase [Chitinophagaceae bacterium]